MTLTKDTNIDQNFVNKERWPVHISPNITVTIIEKLLLIVKTQHFIADGPNVIVNGNNNIITIKNVKDYHGFVRSRSANGNSPVNVMNVHIVSDNSTLLSKNHLLTGAGWIGQQFFTGSINHCYSNGDIGNYCGGIVGSNSNSCTINGSYALGSISGIGAGGIVGSNTSCTITNCYSTNNIIGEHSGGISGENCNCVISGCYSMGDVVGEGSGGITGRNCNGSINNCYSLGDITSEDAGGIAGEFNYGSIVNCYTVGKVKGSKAGSIVGNHNSGSYNLCRSTQNGWDSSASSYLTTGWINPVFNSVNIPFLLRAFDFYKFSRSVDVITTNDLPYKLEYPIIPPIMSTYNIISINNSAPSLFLSQIKLGEIVSPGEKNIEHKIKKKKRLFKKIAKFFNPIKTPKSTEENIAVPISFVGKLFVQFTSSLKKNSYNVVVLSSTPDRTQYNISAYDLTIQEPPCFLKGTYILTRNGECLVENLKIGDELVTPDERCVEITDIYSTVISSPCDEDYPVKIPKNFFLNNVPYRDTYLSRWHAIMWDSNWVQPVRNKKMFETERMDEITYYHVETPEYLRDNIVANGMPCESWNKHKNYTEMEIPCEIENNLGVEIFTHFSRK